MRRIGVLVTCVVLALTLGACKKPIGGTPYISDEPPLWQDGSTITQGQPEATTTVADTSATAGDGTQTTVSVLTGGITTGSTRGTNGPMKKPTGTTTSTVTAATTGGAGNADNEADMEWSTTAVTTTATTAATTTAKPTTTTAMTTTTTTATTTTTTTTTKPTTTTTTRPAVELPAEGYTPDGKIQIGTVTLNGNTVTMEIKNTTKGFETDQSSYIEFICYNQAGGELDRVKVAFGRIHKQQSRSFQFTIPAGTARVVQCDFKAEYWSDGFV